MIKIKNKIIIDFFSYYTSWNISFLILFIFGNLTEYYYDLLFNTLFISACSFYFTYIHPKVFLLKLDEYEYTFVGTKLKLLDLICHHLPSIFLLSYWNYYKDNRTKKYLFLFIPLIYKLLLNDNYERYGLTDITVFSIYFFIFIFYLYFSK